MIGTPAKPMMALSAKLISMNRNSRASNGPGALFGPDFGHGVFLTGVFQIGALLRLDLVVDEGGVALTK